MVIMIVTIIVIMVISDLHFRAPLFVHVLAEYMLLHILHFHHPWWSYAGFASLQGCNLLEQCRSNCRGAKTGDKKFTSCKGSNPFEYGL